MARDPTLLPLDGEAQVVTFIKRPMWNFFCSPEKLNALVEKAKDLPFVTYIAVNKKGATAANIGPTDVNAVTWGVFPAKEVIQPTVIDPVSFMVCKDEAFQAWDQEWASLYPDGDPSGKILEEMDLVLASLLGKTHGDDDGIEQIQSRSIRRRRLRIKATLRIRKIKKRMEKPPRY